MLLHTHRDEVLLRVTEDGPFKAICKRCQHETPVPRQNFPGHENDP